MLDCPCSLHFTKTCIAILDQKIYFSLILYYNNVFEINIKSKLIALNKSDGSISFIFFLLQNLQQHFLFLHHSKNEPNSKNNIFPISSSFLEINCMETKMY